MRSEKQRAANFVPSQILSGGDLTKYGKAQCELGFEFYNGLAEEITVVSRTGVQLIVPPLLGARTHAFVIRSTYGAEQRVIVNTHGLLNDEGPTTSLEAQRIEQALFRDDMRIGRAFYHKANVDYLITREDFDQNGGYLYLSNLDLTLSALNSNYAPKHPYSRAGMREIMLERDRALSRGEGLSYQIRIVDRHGRFGNRFVNLNGEVFHVKTTHDSDALDGVYLITSKPSKGNLSAGAPRSEYYTFEEAAKQLRLYNTYNEAATLGDPDSVFKRELDERAHQIKLEEHNFREEKLKRDREWGEQQRAWEREREAAKVEAARREEALTAREQAYELRKTELERRSLQLKSELEERSFNRKENLEILKHIPALISGIAAIYFAVKKLKGP